MIRELAGRLTAFTELEDFVIIETTFRRGNFVSEARIVKAHSSMAIVRAATSRAELTVKLIRPRRAIEPAFGCRIQSSEKIWRVFTATEVLEFAASVGDTNPIHRINPPIVPGLLILETLLADLKAACVKLKFKHFITAGEPLTLRGSGERFEIIGGGVRKVLGEIL